MPPRSPVVGTSMTGCRAPPQVVLMGLIEGYRVNGGPGGEGLDKVGGAHASTSLERHPVRCWLCCGCSVQFEFSLLLNHCCFRCTPVVTSSTPWASLMTLTPLQSSRRASFPEAGAHAQ